MCHGEHATIRGQLTESAFCLPCGCELLTSGCQSGGKRPSPAEPSLWPTKNVTDSTDLQSITKGPELSWAV